MKRWFGSAPGGTVLQAAVDLRVGGTFEVSFENPDGTRYTCTGEYRSLAEPSTMVFTWSWKNRPSAVELVTVRLEPVENGTVMHFEHSDIDPGTTHDYGAGWRSTFEKLGKALG